MFEQLHRVLQWRLAFNALDMQMLVQVVTATYERPNKEIQWQTASGSCTSTIAQIDGELNFVDEVKKSMELLLTRGYGKAVGVTLGTAVIFLDDMISINFDPESS